MPVSYKTMQKNKKLDEFEEKTEEENKEKANQETPVKTP